MKTYLRKPQWLKVRLPGGGEFAYLRAILHRYNLHTVCEEARCPNLGECWGGGTATFMLLGATCTRNCRFCAVNSGRRGDPLGPEEPENVARAVGELGLEYVVLTSVTRDDLQDGGAGHFAATIRAIKEIKPETLVEALIPDFQADIAALGKVVQAGPTVIGHNLETVARLTPHVRDRHASYQQSLEVLQAIKELEGGIYTKSSLMLALGETENEVLQAMRDLRERGVDILTLGQYLQPTRRHLEVREYITPEQFNHYREFGEQQGFLYVASGPLVRSSYRAGEFFIRSIAERSRS
jgi:lipoic acid synthetase